MERDEAEQIIRRLAAGETIRWRTAHFLKRLDDRDYTIQDADRILRSHELRDDPEWNEKHQNHVVHLFGTAYDGRATELVLGLQRVGPCVFITIKDWSK